MNWHDLDPEELNRRLAALQGLRTAAKRATAALSQFGIVADSFEEEWPEVVLEDILDAQYITDQNSG